MEQNYQPNLAIASYHHWGKGTIFNHWGKGTIFNLSEVVIVKIPS